MTNLGLFVTRWYGGTESQEDCDQMLSFCDKIGVTDIYVSCHEDISTFDKSFDYLQYILQNRGSKNIYAWISRTVGRDNKNNWTKNRMSTLGLKTVTIPDDLGDKVKLDLTDERTRLFFDNRISSLMSQYSELSGYYVDGSSINGKILYIFAYEDNMITDLVESTIKNSITPILYCYGKFKLDAVKNAISKL